MSQKRYRPAVQDKPKAGIKVAISLPMLSDAKAKFTYDFGRLCAFSGMTIVADGVADLQFNMVEGTLISTARNSLVKMARETRATHMLWLDSDMRFPKDALIRLLEHNVPIVGANYVTRRFPIRPVAFTQTDPRVRCRTTPESKGLEEVQGLGFGLVLVQMKVFEQVAFPWFTFPCDAAGNFTGEDVDFCNKARAQGFRIFVDHDLSNEVQHVGEFEFGHEHSAAWLETGLSEDAEEG